MGKETGGVIRVEPDATTVGVPARTPGFTKPRGDSPFPRPVNPADGKGKSALSSLSRLDKRAVPPYISFPNRGGVITGPGTGVMKKKGFNNALYLKEQSAEILARAKKFNNKLYLEFGGKLAWDYHAARVLPGFDPNAKLRLLRQLKDKIEVVICIYAGDIERKKIRADFGIAYDADTLLIIDNFRDWGIEVKSVVVTRYDDRPAVNGFINKLERRGIRVYRHRAIRGYPADVDLIVSDAGYGANEYIETAKPIVAVTGPGPGSGKMATCLSQVYHEHKRGIAAGYAKFETFPVWNLPLNHPVNIAYEAATADIGDVNMVDPFHLERHGVTAVNYNRDIEAFPVVRRICERIMDKSRMYLSPTDMGVNRVGFAISDDAAVREAARQEVIRRCFRYRCEYAIGAADHVCVDRVKALMDNLSLHEEDRAVVAPARAAALQAAKTIGKGNDGFFCGAALQLPGGAIVTGKNSPLLHAASSCVLNAVKKLANLPDDLPLISRDVISSVGKLKKNILKIKRVSLALDETLIALSVSMAHNPTAERAIDQLGKLGGCEMHCSHLPTPGDEAGLRKLGINLTCDPVFASRDLFID